MVGAVFLFSGISAALATFAPEAVASTVVTARRAPHLYRDNFSGGHPPRRQLTTVKPLDEKESGAPSLPDEGTAIPPDSGNVPDESAAIGKKDQDQPTVGSDVVSAGLNPSSEPSSKPSEPSSKPSAAPTCILTSRAAKTQKTSPTSKTAKTENSKTAKTENSKTAKTENSKAAKTGNSKAAKSQATSPTFDDENIKCQSSAPSASSAPTTSEAPSSAPSTSLAPTTSEAPSSFDSRNSLLSAAGISRLGGLKSTLFLIIVESVVAVSLNFL